MIAPGRDAPSLALVRAVIGPLAIERAPAATSNTVLAAPSADPAGVGAAAAWLEDAVSMTGQPIEISAAS